MSKKRKEFYKPLFEVTEIWRIVKVDTGRKVGINIKLEYLSADDAFDSEQDAAEAALRRLGYRVELVSSNAPEM